VPAAGGAANRRTGESETFDSATLWRILETLLYKTHRGRTLFDTRRDFKHMGVTHLGRVYEGLLDVRFDKAAETAVYLECESAATKDGSVETHFDANDSVVIRAGSVWPTSTLIEVNTAMS
jgi:hypothetical protein